MSTPARSPLLAKEDYWAIWFGLGLVLVTFFFYLGGISLKDSIAVSPPRNYHTFAEILGHFGQTWHWYLALYVMFLIVFSVSMHIMGHNLKRFIPSFTILFVVSALILAATNNAWAHSHELNYALVALALGLIVGNVVRLPKWFDAGLRTEYYIKTGIVMLGATLPITLIWQSGPTAFIQATIVSLVTWATIFFIGTRLFKLDRRFAAVMGAAGAVCGVSASLAVGGAVKAEKEHIAISISIVTIAALIMIFLLPVLSNALGLHPAVAGAWIGNSEFADAAGLAAAEAIRATGDEAVRAFTLIKVIGRDIWIGIWAFALSLISVIFWERSKDSPKPSAAVIWERFPKFVIGFFAASAFISTVTFVAISDAGAATADEVDHVMNDVISPFLIKPIKALRTWTFCLTFLCIGLTTRFRELTKFGPKPLWAFALGVCVNVPLGFLLSEFVFGEHWRNL